MLLKDLKRSKKLGYSGRLPPKPIPMCNIISTENLFDLLPQTRLLDVAPQHQRVWPCVQNSRQTDSNSPRPDTLEKPTKDGRNMNFHWLQMSMSTIPKTRLSFWERDSCNTQSLWTCRKNPNERKEPSINTTDQEKLEPDFQSYTCPKTHLKNFKYISGSIITISQNHRW